LIGNWGWPLHEVRHRALLYFAHRFHGFFGRHAETH
jgi:hypothetical protein